MEKVLQFEAKETILDDARVLRIWGYICVSRVGNLIPTILVEAHKSKYSIYLGGIKMYRNLRYWW